MEMIPFLLIFGYACIRAVQLCLVFCDIYVSYPGNTYSSTTITLYPSSE